MGGLVSDSAIEWWVWVGMRVGDGDSDDLKHRKKDFLWQDGGCMNNSIWPIPSTDVFDHYRYSTMLIIPYGLLFSLKTMPPNFTLKMQ